MVGRVGNKVGVVVTNYDMVGGPLVAKEASSRFHHCPHFYIWFVTLVTMGNHLSDVLPYIYDIHRCYLMGIPIGDV